ncbi:MAG: hypothetical protein ACLT98_00790 [Eggerthellaceae bacterium]
MAIARRSIPRRACRRCRVGDRVNAWPPSPTNDIERRDRVRQRQDHRPRFRPVRLPDAGTARDARRHRGPAAAIEVNPNVTLTAIPQTAEGASDAE